MKNLFLIAVVFGFSSVATAQTLIWSDEFSGTQLDVTKWNYETGTGVDGNWGTGQLDAATNRPENVRIENGIAGADGGVLVIATTKENYNVPGGGVRQYTSGRINTKDKASWGPGHRIVARVWPKDVRYQGQGFAFWMMPQEIPTGYNHLMWPQGGEIDIMEFVGMTPYANLGSVHYAPNWNNNQWSANNHWHQGAYYSYEKQENPGPFPQWLYVDLTASIAIKKVILRWETAFGKSYEIQTSDDAVTWTTRYITTNSNGGVDDISVEATARYVRLYATERGTEWGYSLYEIEVYDDSETNRALNKTAIASSFESNLLTADKAVDGNASTRWASGDINSPAGGWPVATDDIHAGSHGFKEYGIDWFDNRLEFHVDGNVYHIHYFEDGGAFAKDGNNQAGVSVIKGKRVYRSEFSHRFPQWHPFEHKFFAILSAGVGGQNTYGGTIVPEAEFPCTVYVDWVRIYAFNNVTSAGEDEGIEAVPAYPNPTSDDILLPTVNPGTRITLINTNGRSSSKQVEDDHRVYVGDLTPGLYVLSIPGKRTSFIKIIKR